MVLTLASAADEVMHGGCVPRNSHEGKSLSWSNHGVHGFEATVLSCRSVDATTLASLVVPVMMGLSDSKVTTV